MGVTHMGRLQAQLRRSLRTGRRRHRRRAPLWVGSLLGIAAAALLLSSVERQLRPVLETMAEAEAKNKIVEIMDQAIAEELSAGGTTYEDLIHIETDEAGEISALTSDMSALNRLRTEILRTIVADLDTLSGSELSIPVGNLTGIHILSGKGASLPIEVIAVGSVHGDYRHHFENAGINQTRHQISLELTVTAEILLPGETLHTQVTADIPVAETVIVGPVPDTYLQLGADA